MTPDRIVPSDGSPIPRGAITLVYQRETIRYWVYGTAQAPGQPLPDLMATIHRRKGLGQHPQFLYLTLQESAPTPIVEGRFMDDEDDHSSYRGTNEEADA